MLTHRWQALAESQFPWVQDALLCLRERLPDQEPVRVWANVEFLSLDGRMNEVDLIVLTAKGMFLVEIKSRPGEVTGDQQRWTWRDGASLHDIDNPLRLANLKAKRLAELLPASESGRYRAIAVHRRARLLLRPWCPDEAARAARRPRIRS